MRPSVVRALCFCGKEGGTFTRFSVRKYARGCWNRIYGHMWAWGKRIKLDFWLYDTRCVFGHFECVGWREGKLTRFLVGQYIHMMSTERKKTLEDRLQKKTLDVFDHQIDQKLATDRRAMILSFRVWSWNVRTVRYSGVSGFGLKLNVKLCNYYHCR